MRKKLLNRRHRLWILGCAAALTALPAVAESSYSYPRVLEGSATVTTYDGETEGVDLHQPILVGDRVRVPHGSRLELVLADRGLLRLGGDSEIDFERIAYSAETDDRATVMRLHYGEAQLIVPEDALGDALPQLETPSATIYVHRAGSFRITVGADGWTELVVRDGLAELVSDRGSLLVHAGDQGWVQGGRQARLELRVADARDSLERWGDWLSAEAVRADVPYVDESIRYAARPLAEHGVWVEVGHRRAWRPKVVVDWRPYVRGYWRHTPIGLTWVSNDPWGYVTHHYGSWDLVPGHGWVWYPGAAYAPARVHWYWGPSYVGWCPSGYYRNHYGHRRGFGLSVGLYGWAGGSWHPFRHWSFTLHVNFGHRRQHRHVHHGAHFAHRHGGPRLERGIITTEPRARRGRHHETFADLRREAERRERQNGRPLPDVSDFIARKPLAGDLERTLFKPKPTTPKPEVRIAPPRVARNKPLERERPSPRADSPRREWTKPLERPAPRAEAPRADRTKPEIWSKPVPRVESPRADRAKPDVRSKPVPRVESPRADRRKPETWTKPVPRAESPRADRRKPETWSKPVPRVESPRTDGTKPAPRYESPRVDRTKPTVRPKPTPRYESPRVDRTKPTMRPKPTPRYESPRIDRSKPSVRPTPSPPRVDRTKPSVRPKPSPPRVDRTKPSVRPTPSPPRVDRSKPSVRPKPSPPRVNRSKPSARPSPAPRPKPTARAAPAPRPDRQVDRNRSQGQSRPRAQAAKPRPEKKEASNSRARDSKSRERDD